MKFYSLFFLLSCLPMYVKACSSNQSKDVGGRKNPMLLLSMRSEFPRSDRIDFSLYRDKLSGLNVETNQASSVAATVLAQRVCGKTVNK